MHIILIPMNITPHGAPLVREVRALALFGLDLICDLFMDKKDDV